MADAGPLNQPFWKPKISALDAAEGVRREFSRFANTQSNRRELATRYAVVTESMNLTHLGPYGYSYDCAVPEFADDCASIKLIRNSGHALIDTLVSKIGAIDPPLPTLLTSKGKWKDRRQASDLELLARAEYASRKGFHANLHQVWIAALKLAAGCTGTAAVQFYDDCGQVGARIHDTLDMFWSNDLRTQGCITWLPVDDAVELYPDSETDIRASVGEPPPEWQQPTRNGEKLTDFVCVYEAWRGARGGKPGRHVVCVKLGDAIVSEDYPHESAPMVWLTCIPHMYGPLGHSMLHHVYESIKRDNLVLTRVDRAINKTNLSITYAAKGSFEMGETAMAVVEDNKTVWLADSMTTPPTTITPAGFAPELLTVADRHNTDVHDVSGMAQSNTTGQRQEGVDSAIGQRYVAALVNERFASLQGRYIQAVAIDSAKVVIQILCDIFEDDPKLLRLAPAQDTLREVSGAVALKGIEQLKYVVEYQAVSGNKGNPADRMQTAFELKQLGILSEEGYAAMQDDGEDLPYQLQQMNVQTRWTEKQMHRWMFSAENDTQKADFYVPPFAHMKLGTVLLQVIDGYLEAQIEDLEPERLDYFLMFIADCGALAAQAPPEAPDATGAGGAPQPPPPMAPSAQPGPTAPAAPALAA